MSAKNKVEPTFTSIYRAVEQKAAKTRFLKDTATQITLKGNLDNQPFYVKVEDGIYRYYVNCNNQIFGPFDEVSLIFTI